MFSVRSAMLMESKGLEEEQARKLERKIKEGMIIRLVSECVFERGKEVAYGKDTRLTCICHRV